MVCVHDCVHLQQEREPEAIVGAGLRRNEFAERSRNELVGEWTLGYSLRKDRIGAGHARANNESGKERQVGDRKHDAQTSAKPHDRHDRKQANCHFLPPQSLVFGGELEACNN